MNRVKVSQGPQNLLVVCNLRVLVEGLEEAVKEPCRLSDIPGKCLFVGQPGFLFLLWPNVLLDNVGKPISEIGVARLGRGAE